LIIGRKEKKEGAWETRKTTSVKEKRVGGV